MGSNASNGKLGEVEKGRGGRAKGMRQRTHAKKIYDIVARRVAGMSPEEGAATLRPSPKRYRPTREQGRRHQGNIAQEARPNVQGVHRILASREAEEAEGARLIVERQAIFVVKFVIKCFRGL